MGIVSYIIKGSYIIEGVIDDLENLLKTGYLGGGVFMND